MSGIPRTFTLLDIPPNPNHKSNSNSNFNINPINPTLPYWPYPNPNPTKPTSKSNPNRAGLGEIFERGINQGELSVLPPDKYY